MTMENFKELPLEVRLSAYLDGQVEAEDARELEALIASDAEAKAIYEQLNLKEPRGLRGAAADILSGLLERHLVRAERTERMPYLNAPPPEAPRATDQS